MNRWINERTSEWTVFFSYIDAMDASENDDFPTDFAIFTKALGTNGPTDRWTDIAPHRDAIITSTNGFNDQACTFGLINGT